MTGSMLLKTMLSVIVAGTPVLALAQTAVDLAAMGCGSLVKVQGGYGPFDYRVDKGKLGIVESFHFDARVESLARGKSTFVGGDLDYTLRAFPNHHRALLAMMNLGIKEKTSRPKGSRFTVECWMLRAEAFRPDDPLVKIIHGLFQLRHGRPAEALEKLDAARQLGVTDPNAAYNLGLAYLELKEYDKALEAAHRAYAAGFPLPGLRERLVKAGKWRDPQPASAPAADSAPSAARPAANQAPVTPAGEGG